MFNDALSEMTATDQARDAHADGCIECGAPGCKGCQSAFCELPRLVEHAREWMCPGCVARFDAHVTNRCTGDVCNCDACPEVIDDEAETTPVPHEPMARMVWGRFAAVAGILLALVSGATGCTAHATAGAPEAENVGTLAGGSSVYTQPVHETTEFHVEATARARKQRQAPAAKRDDDAAPTIEEKSAHGF
jgi:hypothetical protein